MRLLVYLVLSVVFGIVGVKPAGAVGWTDQLPSVVVNESIAYASRTYCPTFYQTVEILGDSKYEACVFVGQHLSMANYRVAGQPRVATKFPYGNHYYRLTDVCEQYWGCVYSDEGDVLVEHQLVNGKVTPVVYKDARSRLHALFPFSHGFDRSEPYIPFRGVAVPKFSLSTNGKWLVGELKGQGLGLADLKNETVHTVATTGDLYGRGFDPQMELAVSNDGKSVVVVGLNVGVRLYDITPECLQHQSCQSIDAGMAGMIASFRSAHLPRFGESSELLKAALVSQTTPSRIVILGKAGRAERPQYMALGDSFTSGEGETDPRYYEPLTNIPENTCHVSLRSYPYLLGIASTQNLACAGATIADVLTETMYPNQSSALIESIAGTRPQAAFVERAQPKLVTVGIGGNDAGLMAKLKVCAMPGTCHWVESEGLRATAQEIASLFDRLVAMYQELIGRAPATRFVAVGYPLTVAEGEGCGLLTSVLLDRKERRFMNEGIRYLNQVVRAAAMVAGIGFIDSEASFDGHALCSNTTSPAMNGLRFGGDIAPLQSLPTLKVISSASFHPTPRGHSLLADKVRDVYGDISAYPWCENGRITCPQSTTFPEPSDYWPPGKSDTTARYARLVVDQSLDGNVLVIKSPDWFQPNETVQMTLQSKPTDLGLFLADESGGIAETVEIPAALEDGYHTLTLVGTSSEGSSLSLYQEVVVQNIPPPVTPEDAVIEEDQSIAPARGHTTEPSLVAFGIPPDLATQLTDNRSVLGAAAQAKKVAGTNFCWLLAMASITFMAYLAVKWRRIAYNGTMASIRTIVKKLIPRTLFKKIEPLGHLFESILMNIRYGFPGRKLRIIGVTGTNGKTTTSFMIQRLLHESGIKAGLLTTVANGVGDDIVPQAEHITTAQASKLQRRLRDYARQGVEWVVVETSSHALAQNRVWGLPYEIAVMTNITHEHLDYHGTFERYVEAKRRLFKIANRHGFRFGVVNAQDPSAEKFTRTVANHTTYGIGEGDLRAEKVKLSAEGSRYQAKIDKDSYDITVNIPGEFNVSNSLAAIAVGRKLGLTKTEIEKGIIALRSVEGRMNVIDEGQPFRVIVDFASTPDAFERLFESIRPLTKGKLIAVFGSAGRRDEAKRPVQGEIAGRSADVVILTEEDDRDIDGNQILREIAKGAKKAKKKEGKDLFLILNREEAIGFAMTQATSKDDVVVLLGKGHEHTIERADGEYPWNEAEVARAALQALKTSSR